MLRAEGGSCKGNSVGTTGLVFEVGQREDMCIPILDVSCNHTQGVKTVITWVNSQRTSVRGAQFTVY
ncbi:hypothetical protein THAOC_11005 [Thalassiosira oceanica]|uniref:Uncharacterized protein n=1 Tax=Thalassiosira oceanica TaxID=159749 RepID=K0TBN0_THAOC|nr:hypothetical protein THAOC_11005 [Thalassiosira oceanica]|eukprot:EJK67892.1 hypothetical protein THAOC_11005 [Thalassiosira oceanica]